MSPANLVGAVPDGLAAITPHIVVPDAAVAAECYGRALGAGVFPGMGVRSPLSRR